MSRRLPSLNALRAFEAAARYGSFTRAAEELGVTSAAVGQQVRGLEENLGIQLFYRSLDGLDLTTEAKTALPQIRQGFDLLSEGVQTLISIHDQDRLSISVAPTFAIKWLVPRLHHFYEKHPGIELRFDTSMRYADIVRGESDLAIRFGIGPYNGLRKERLLEEYVLPLCSPKLCLGGGDIRDVTDLHHFTLLHVDGETRDKSWLDWPSWGNRHNLDATKLKEGPRFTQSTMALQAAVQGQGIVLCGITFSIDEILAGNLVAPFGARCVSKTRFTYDLVYLPARAKHPAFVSFQRWIKERAKESKQLIDDYLEKLGQR